MAAACIHTQERERAQQKTNGLYQHFCLGDSRPSALALKSDNLVPPRMSLAPLGQLPQCRSSERVSPSPELSLRAGSLRRISATPTAVSLSHDLYWFSQAEVEAFSSWH